MAYTKVNWTSTTPINATNLNKMDNAIEQHFNDVDDDLSNINNLINEKATENKNYTDEKTKKSIMTLTSSASQTISKNAETIVKLNNVISVGDKLTADTTNSKIIVGSNVSYVKASFHLQGNTQARAWVKLHHFNSNGNVIDTISSLGFNENDYFTHWDGTPRLMEVSEGDYFILKITGNADCTLNGSISNLQASYITIEVVE